MRGFSGSRLLRSVAHELSRLGAWTTHREEPAPDDQTLEGTEDFDAVVAAYHVTRDVERVALRVPGRFQGWLLIHRALLEVG